jgi:methyl-accepting chemotaxis protein
VVDGTRDAFLRIGSSVDDVSERIEPIAASAQELSTNAEALNHRVSGFKLTI